MVFQIKYLIVSIILEEPRAKKKLESAVQVLFFSNYN